MTKTVDRTILTGKLPDGIEKFRSSRMEDRSAFHTTSALGKTRELTPEGYLLCKDVCIARTGEQMYAHHEQPHLDADGDGVITVMRLPEEVFNPIAIASFEGKSITVEHPNEFVGPSNVRQHEVGTIHNVHRGEGIEDDHLVADLLIKDPAAITYAKKYLPEVSCGYDCAHEQTEPGRAIQRNIRGNHVALVDRGRAGPRCAIKDAPADPLKFTTENIFMAQENKASKILERIKAAFIAKNHDAIAQELSNHVPEPEEIMTTPTTTTDKRLQDALDWIEQRKNADAEAAIKAEVDKRVKAALDAKKTEDEAKILTDAEAARVEAAKVAAAEVSIRNPDLGVTWTGDSLRVFQGRVEVLSPGLKVPTVDAANGAKDVIPNIMLASVKAAYGTEKGKKVVDSVLAERKIESYTVDNIAELFNASAALMAIVNTNDARPTDLKAFGKTTKTVDVAKTLHDFWEPIVKNMRV